MHSIWLFKACVIDKNMVRAQNASFTRVSIKADTYWPTTPGCCHTPCDSSHWLCHYNFISHRSSTPPNMRTSKVMGFFVLFCFLHTPSDLADRTFLRFPQQFYFNSGQAQLYTKKTSTKCHVHDVL